MSEKTEKLISFIELVESYPCLYNNTLGEYSRKNITEKAWLEISENMNWTVSDCKEKWRNLRNGLVKSLKIPPTGSAKTKKQYYLHDIMQFVIPFTKPMNTEAEPDNNPIPSSPVNTCASDEVSEIEELNTTKQCSINMPARSFKRKLNRSRIAVGSISGQHIAAKRKSIDNDGQSKLFNPRKMFLLSLLPDVENLTDNNMRLLKIEMLSLIQKYQVAQQNEELL